jgi:hypothetical protein
MFYPTHVLTHSSHIFSPSVFKWLTPVYLSSWASVPSPQRDLRYGSHYKAASLTCLTRILPLDSPSIFYLVFTYKSVCYVFVLSPIPQQQIVKPTRHELFTTILFPNDPKKIWWIIVSRWSNVTMIISVIAISGEEDPFVRQLVYIQVLFHLAVVKT